MFGFLVIFVFSGLNLFDIIWLEIYGRRYWVKIYFIGNESFKFVVIRFASFSLRYVYSWFRGGGGYLDVVMGFIVIDVSVDIL